MTLRTHSTTERNSVSLERKRSWQGNRMWDRLFC